MRLVASELRKILTTWAVLLYLGVQVAFLVLVVVATLVTTDDAEFGEQQIRDLFAAAGITTILALLLGILVFTAEFRHGTAPETFLVTPKRERVVAAKAIVGLLVGALLGLLALAQIAAMTAPWLSLRDVPYDFWTDELVALYAATLGLSALWGVLGIGSGGAIRNQVAAVVGTLVWFLVVENIVFGLLPDTGRFLPGIASNATLEPDSSTEDLGSRAGWAVTLAWAAGVLLIATLLVRERDVT